MKRMKSLRYKVIYVFTIYRNWTPQDSCYDLDDKVNAQAAVIYETALICNVRFCASGCES